ncbi:helix-turn-helix transcriptional regulator [Paucibacter sp. R3-3]|uniref:Helix-turn-helix transcriptional regulator n=1 Tax=Roseateles agri TaxID=3098619 RepID=A0ABU5DPY1_9BURK|nr:helix-turn-helix transcriptional regulator [Paucibacter sp. R3-3]MDY0747783.1 helix-turn-helix transcriptional regulator [Paucibacter sp. R3-3]
MNRHLLQQLGERLRALRIAQSMTQEQMAKAADIDRKTLRSVEAGEPTPSIGTYLRVMTELGINGELALLTGDTMTPAPAGSVAARSKHLPPAVTVNIQPSALKHQTQDLLSTSLHEEAVRVVKADPSRLEEVHDVLAKWIRDQPNSRSISLWREWEKILADHAWRKVLGSTARAQQLRSASPMGVVVSDAARKAILEQLSTLKKGVVLNSASALMGSSHAQDNSTEHQATESGLIP